MNLTFSILLNFLKKKTSEKTPENLSFKLGFEPLIFTFIFFIFILLFKSVAKTQLYFQYFFKFLNLSNISTPCTPSRWPEVQFNEISSISALLCVCWDLYRGEHISKKDIHTAALSNLSLNILIYISVQHKLPSYSVFFSARSLIDSFYNFCSFFRVKNWIISFSLYLITKIGKILLIGTIP